MFKRFPNLVKRLVLVHGASVDAQDLERGFFPLVLAAEVGSGEIIEFLLRQGADIRVPSYSGASPLYLAAQNGHVDAVAIFLKAGADLEFLYEYKTEPTPSLI